MRKLIWMMSVSVDGFMAGPEGELDWHSIDHEVHSHLNDELGAMSVFLSGRVSYELMDDFWPTADADPDAEPEMIEFAQIWRRMPRIVYSRTLQAADANTTIVREVVPTDIEELKRRDGGDLLLGGAVIGNTFMRLDLVDEYRLYVHPMVLGRGQPAFHPNDERHPVELVEHRAFSKGVLLLRYARARA